jgi:hypothetical protein
MAGDGVSDGGADSDEEEEVVTDDVMWGAQAWLESLDLNAIVASAFMQQLRAKSSNPRYSI